MSGLGSLVTNDYSQKVLNSARLPGSMQQSQINNQNHMRAQTSMGQITNPVNQIKVGISPARFSNNKASSTTRASKRQGQITQQPQKSRSKSPATTKRQGNEISSPNKMSMNGSIGILQQNLEEHKTPQSLSASQILASSLSTANNIQAIQAIQIQQLKKKQNHILQQQIPVKRQKKMNVTQSLDMTSSSQNIQKQMQNLKTNNYLKNGTAVGRQTRGLNSQRGALPATVQTSRSNISSIKKNVKPKRANSRTSSQGMNFGNQGSANDPKYGSQSARKNTETKRNIGSPIRKTIELVLNEENNKAKKVGAQAKKQTHYRHPASIGGPGQQQTLILRPQQLNGSQSSTTGAQKIGSLDTPGTSTGGAQYPYQGGGTGEQIEQRNSQIQDQTIPDGIHVYKNQANKELFAAASKAMAQPKVSRSSNFAKATVKSQGISSQIKSQPIRDRNRAVVSSLSTSGQPMHNSSKKSLASKKTSLPIQSRGQMIQQNHSGPLKMADLSASQLGYYPSQAQIQNTSGVTQNSQISINQSRLIEQKNRKSLSKSTSSFHHMVQNLKNKVTTQGTKSYINQIPSQKQNDNLNKSGNMKGLSTSQISGKLSGVSDSQQLSAPRKRQVANNQVTSASNNLPKTAMTQRKQVDKWKKQHHRLGYGIGNQVVPGGYHHRRAKTNAINQTKPGLNADLKTIETRKKEQEEATEVNNE